METKKAFQIRAEVKDKSWLFRSGTIAATNETEAIQKAKTVLKLTDEHKIEIVPVTVHHSTTKLTSESYPYGRLRTTAFFNVEHTKNGFRTVFQTINPKNGRINAPKKSTYYHAILPMINETNGHIDFCGYLDFNGDEAINKGLYFMSDFYELFTPEQIKEIALYIIAMCKVDMKCTAIYGGAKFEDLKPLYEAQTKTLAEIANTGENRFLECLLDEAKIEATKPENFSPFKVTNYQTA